MREPNMKSSLLTTFKEYGLVTVGLLAYALGWSIFLLPNNLIGGGVSGFASIVFYATGIPMGVTYLVLNVILLILGTKILGTGFGGKTVYAIIITAIMLAVLPGIIPKDFIHEFALSNGKLLCTILGGVIAGFGIGLSISQGGSTGGTDIVALLWCKFHSASPGYSLLSGMWSRSRMPSIASDTPFIRSLSLASSSGEYGRLILAVISFQSLMPSISE